MTSSEHLIDTCDGEHIDVRSGGAKLANPWVETAWAVLEAADDLGDEIPIEACQRVIDDDFGGRLPAQSDVNAVFVFLNSHGH
jgi:hypothetical protein